LALGVAVRFTRKGISVSDLMGELSHFLALPSYQLALPLSHEAWRELTYTQMLTGTDS
jgi:hypothetical protein